MPRFDELPPAVQEAMLTPFHLILEAEAHLSGNMSQHTDTSSGAVFSKTGALYLGSLAAVIDPSVDRLRELHIFHIVQVMDLPWLVLTQEEGFDCYKFPIEDLPTQPLGPEALEKICAYIHKVRTEGNSVLVHCQQGVSRSATVIIAYLMRYEGMGLAEALAFVKDKRACVKPNHGFVKCLQVWEQE